MENPVPQLVVDLTADEIRDARARLGPRVLTTPVLHWEDPLLEAKLPVGTRLSLKLELFQRTGSFKARGALLNTDLLSAEQKARGITAISAGNHAIAAAFAAREAGTHAKVVMTASASPLRVARVRAYGGEVISAPDVHTGFEWVRRIAEEEGRTLLHPFEGRTTALGTATVALEFLEQCPDLEAIIVPIGGGGLAAGIAAAVKVLAPQVLVYGVEPEGADSMHRSFAAGSPSYRARRYYRRQFGCAVRAAHQLYAVSTTSRRLGVGERRPVVGGDAVTGGERQAGGRTRGRGRYGRIAGPLARDLGRQAGGLDYLWCQYRQCHARHKACRGDCLKTRPAARARQRQLSRFAVATTAGRLNLQHIAGCYLHGGAGVE